MKTKVIRMNPQQLDMEGIREAGEILKQGGLVAFPTETVYGLGGNGLDPQASAKIYQAKGRPSDNPLIIHIADMEDLAKIVKEVPESAKKLASVYWPGPLTMIFEKSDIVPYETTGGMDTVAVRMPDHPLAQALIRAGGSYVAAPSANTSGRPSPTMASHVEEDLDGKIDMVLDGGPGWDRSGINDRGFYRRDPDDSASGIYQSGDGKQGDRSGTDGPGTDPGR